MANGDYIGTFDHDTHGWVGMEAVEEVIEGIASRLGVQLVDKYIDDEN